MNKDILEQLKLTLNQIEIEQIKQAKIENEIISLETEKIYFEIWQLILSTILKEKYFCLGIIIEDRFVTLKINNELRKKIKIKKRIPFENIKNKLVEDGLKHNEYKCNAFDISIRDLKRIVEPKPKEKSYGGFQFGPCEGQADY